MAPRPRHSEANRRRLPDLQPLTHGAVHGWQPAEPELGVHPVLRAGHRPQDCRVASEHPPFPFRLWPGRRIARPDVPPDLRPALAGKPAHAGPQPPPRRDPRPPQPTNVGQAGPDLDRAEGRPVPHAPETPDAPPPVTVRPRPRDQAGRVLRQDRGPALGQRAALLPGQVLADPAGPGPGGGGQPRHPPPGPRRHAAEDGRAADHGESFHPVPGIGLHTVAHQRTPPVAARSTAGQAY